MPVIDNEIVNQPDAMHQLYLMWGYDASAREDTRCARTPAKVNLMCKQGNASPETLAQEGYPWVSELKTSGHLNYAVVARVGDTSIDLLMNNRTWRVSRSWFNRHATGNFTQLHRLTPEGKDAIGAASDSKDMAWLDQQLSLALSQPETHARIWTAEMMKRTREFQQKMHLHVDGIPGEDTLMQLMRVTNSTPSVLIQATRTTPDAKMQEKKAYVDHLSCGPAQLYNRGSGLVFVPSPQPEERIRQNSVMAGRTLRHAGCRPVYARLLEPTPPGA